MTESVTKKKFWKSLMKGVYGPRQGGARILVDAEGASTGVGKTSLAVALARLCSLTFDYDLRVDDFTLSGKEYLDRWREHPGADQPSVIVLDEVTGAGAGDSRRAISNQNVELGRAWQLMRKKRIVTICTLPHWSDADLRMRRFADYRLWCMEEPIGYFRPYKVGATFDDGTPQTYRLGEQPIKFPDMKGEGDSFYAAVTEKKDELLDSQFFDADELAGDGGGEDEQPDVEEIERDKTIEVAQQLRKNGLTTREVADAVGYSHTWVIENTDAPANQADS